jgi:hypothetical protein
MMLLIWQRGFQSRLRRHCTPAYAAAALVCPLLRRSPPRHKIFHWLLAR